MGQIGKGLQVGFFVISALLIVYFGYGFLKGEELFSDKNTYYTIYENGQGISTSSPILINGMVVGSVQETKILPKENFSAKVTLKIDKGIQLTSDTIAKLVTRGFLDVKGIELNIGEGDPLPNYSMIPGKIEQGFGEAFTRNAVPALADVKDTSVLMNKFMLNLVDNTQKFNAIIANMEAMTEHMRIFSSFAGHESSLGKNLSDISAALSSEETGIRPLLIQCNKLMEGIEGKESKQVMKQIGNLLGHLEGAAEEQKNSLGMLFHERALYDNLNRTLESLHTLLEDMHDNPWRYVHFSIFGGRTKRAKKAKR